MSGQLASDYSPQSLSRVKATCLTVAQVLGDEMVDETVIVGGVVPSLLFADVEPDPEIGEHVGTLDLDVAMDLVVLDDQRYDAISDRLRRSGFEPDRNEKDNITRQRWRSAGGATIDFIMPPVPPDDRGNRLQHFGKDFAAITMRGMDLAYRYRTRVVLSGADLSGRYVERSIPLCRPDIFILSKALALKYRDKAKDAYDIHFVLKYFADGPQSLGHQLGMLPSHDTRLEMIESLERDYMSVNTRGPQMVCSFLARDDDDLAADALAQVRAFLAGFHG